jgi:hypothetical protein
MIIAGNQLPLGVSETMKQRCARQARGKKPWLQSASLLPKGEPGVIQGPVRLLNFGEVDMSFEGSTGVPGSEEVEETRKALNGAENFVEGSKP